MYITKLRHKYINKHKIDIDHIKSYMNQINDTYHTYDTHDICYEYYIYGKCEKECPYKHDPKYRGYCILFSQKGFCKKNCPYSHHKPYNPIPFICLKWLLYGKCNLKDCTKEHSPIYQGYCKKHLIGKCPYPSDECMFFHI